VSHVARRAAKRLPMSTVPACVRCRTSKVRCEGGIPCTRCVRLNEATGCKRCPLRKRGRKRKTDDGAVSHSSEEPAGSKLQRMLADYEAKRQAAPVVVVTAPAAKAAAADQTTGVLNAVALLAAALEHAPSPVGADTSPAVTPESASAPAVPSGAPPPLKSADCAGAGLADVSPPSVDKTSFAGPVSSLALP
jgi:hypothetical protein